MNQLPECFFTTPIVYAVGKNYQIMVPVKSETLMWVKIGNRTFYDESNGVLRSDCTTHRVTVPMGILDAARKYTVCYRVVKNRKPYFPEVGDVEEYESVFRPVEREPICLYHIADAHNAVEKPVAAGGFFGDRLDLLVLNGDIPNHSGDISYFNTVHEIASRITKGEIPVVFSRGNHDMRGIYAERFWEYTPTEQGNTYYTFRLGALWGVVLDCGEDKSDDHPEYGGTICCHAFRERQTAFLKSLIANSKNEYDAAGVKYRVVVVHNPFTETFDAPFDIEQEEFGRWTQLLREHIKPCVMLSGHVHRCYISENGGAHDHKGQPCPVIVASDPRNDGYVGGAITLDGKTCNVKFTDHEGKIRAEETLEF